MEDDQFYQFYNCIDGRLQSGSQQGRAVDPSNTKELWEVALATPDDLERAVKSATNAFASWSATKWEERANLLREAYDVLSSKREQMALLLRLETGKPVRNPPRQRISRTEGIAAPICESRSRTLLGVVELSRYGPPDIHFISLSLIAKKQTQRILVRLAQRSSKTMMNSSSRSTEFQLVSSLLYALGTILLSSPWAKYARH